VDRHTERFEENGSRHVHRIGEWEEESGGPGKERSQTAIGVREPEEADVRAEVAPTSQAQLAPLARVGRIDRHAEAATRPGRDDAGDLVAKHEWMAGYGAAEQAVGVPVAVRSAQTDGLDADELLSGSRDGVGLFVQSDVRRPVQSERPQGSGWP
jgi:hypothetical protein